MNFVFDQKSQNLTEYSRYFRFMAYSLLLLFCNVILISIIIIYV